MRTHTTTTLRKLILEEMNPNNTMSLQKIETWSDLLPEIKTELDTQLDFFARSIFHKSLVRAQLNQMQKECTFLLNTVDKYGDLSSDLQPLKVLLIDCLDSTLSTIINFYKEYADLTMQMAGIHFRNQMEIFKKHLKKIEVLLAGLGVEPELQKIVLACIHDLLKKKSANYLTVNYVLTLQLDLLELLPDLTKDEARQQLSIYLYHVHYNTVGFIEFLRKDYKAELELIPDLYDKQSFLVRVCQGLEKPKASKKLPIYLPQNHTIYDRLIRFIHGEIDCLKIAIRKAAPIPVLIAAPVPVPYMPVNYKLRFNFSVDCLAYLIKLMVDANLIEPGLKSEMQRYIAAHFETPGTAATGISPGSFLTKYKNVTQTTSVTVKAGLLAMIKLIDKNF